MLLVLGCRTAGTPRDIPSRLDALFTDLHARDLFSGAVVVGRGGDIVFEKGYGYADVERQVPFTPDTPADAASLAKTFTAATLVAMAQEGRVDLDAPVQRLLPELPYPEITLRHLLSHTSGMSVTTNYEYFDQYLPKDQVRTTDLLLGVIAMQKPPLSSTPGTSFEYNSFGFDLAALAAARAAGQTLHQLFTERIFKPLGMSSAFLRPGRLTDFPGVRTLGYRRTEGKLELNDVFDLESFHGGSNVYVSARDLHRWNASFLERALFDNDTLAAIHAPARVGGAPSGLTLGGWYRSAAGTAFSYAGHLQGFRDEVFRDTRSRWSIVYVSNNTLEPWLQHRIVRSVNAIVQGQEHTPLVPPDVNEISKEERKTLAGRWVMSDGNALTIAFSDGLLISVNDVSYPMFQVDPRTFYVPGLDYMVAFRKGANGSPEKINVSTNFDERWGTRAGS